MSDTPQKRKIILAPEQFQELNALLYSSNPADYLNLRQDGILRRYAAQDAPAEPVRVGDLEVREWLASTDTVDEKAALALDGEILLHHAGESLFKLYLVHADKPECPWFEVVKLSDFNRIKAAMQAFVDDPAQHRATVREVFLGGPHPAGPDNVSQAEWDSAARAYCTLLSYVAEHLLGGASLYNAAKHGMTAIVQDIGTMNLRPTGGQGQDGVDLLSGLAATYLHQIKGQRGRPEYERWKLVNQAITIERTLYMTSLVINALRSLWSVARARYVGHDGAALLLDEDAVHAAACAGGRVPGKIVDDLKSKEKGHPWGSGMQPADLRYEAEIPSDDVLEAAARWQRSNQTMRHVPIVAERRLPEPAEGDVPLLCFGTSPTWAAAVWQRPGSRALIKRTPERG